jgi:hypothetical protein
MAFGCISVFAVDIGVYVTVDDNMVTTIKTQNDWRAEVDQMLFEANEIYDDSGVAINLVSSHVDFRNFTYTTSAGLLSEIAAEDNEFVNILRDSDRHGADYIVALTELDALNLCGQAISVNTSQATISSTDQAIALSDPDCGQDTFVHELGHLMGLAHGDQVSAARNNTVHSTALTNYAKGWGNTDTLESAGDTWADENRESGEYGTLMVGNHIMYWTGTTWNVRVPLFSSINNFHVLCGTDISGNDIPCGDATNGDAARALNENSLTYAGHEAKDADHLSYADSQLTTCLTNGYSDVEVVDLQTLNCSSKSISGLVGVEQLSSLRNVDLSNNSIVNVSPLESLSSSNIQTINLLGNNNALCHQLDNLDAKFPGSVTMPDSCFNLGAFIPVLSLLLN